MQFGRLTLPLYGHSNPSTIAYLPLLTNFFSSGFPFTVLKRLNNSSVSGAEVTALFGGLGLCSFLSSGGVTGRSVNSLSGL